MKGYTWSIQYGDGSGAAGVVYKDTVVIGGASVSSQAVEAATSVSSQFVRDTSNSGLVGLAFSTINTVEPKSQTTFFGNVKPSLPRPLFTANLQHQAPGRYDFGFVDHSQFTGNVTYVPVNPANGFWEFSANGYQVGATAFVSDTIDAIADTGTTLLYIDDSILAAYYARVAGSSNSQTYGGYVYPCGAKLPSLTFGIGSYKAVIPGKYLNYGPVATGSTTCYGGAQSNAGIGFSIFGDVFLVSQFVVFDGIAAPRIGFAAKPTN